MEEREDFSRPPVGLFFLSALAGGLVALSFLSAVLAAEAQGGSSAPLPGLLILLIRMGRLRIGPISLPPLLMALWCETWWFWTRDRRRRLPPPEAYEVADLLQRERRTKWLLWFCLAVVWGAIAYVLMLDWTVFVNLQSSVPPIVYPAP